MKHFDIRARMLLAALLPLVLITTLLAGVFMSARFDDMHAAYERRNLSVGRQVALASEYGLFSANHEQLQALVNGALHELDVRWVAILDNRGKLLVSAGQPAYVVAVNLRPFEQKGFLPDKRLDWLAQPVYPNNLQVDDLYEKGAVEVALQPSQMGTVVMAFSREAIDARKNSMLLVGAGIALLSLLFGMAVAAYLSRGVIRPIERISQLVERIGQGDFAGANKLRTLSTEQDPLRDLQSRIHLMADRLSVARDELRQQVELATQALREKKDEAERANLAKSRFLAAASHDLRQPTHALGLFVSRLAQLPHDAQTADLIDNLAASVRAMQDLLDGLLDVSRLEANAVQVNKQPFAISDLFNQLTQDLSASAHDRQLRLHIRPTSLWAFSDATLVYRILLNLASNALRYTEQGGVLVAARADSQRGVVKIQVWDSGIGIAPEHQTAVFTEFFQVGNLARDRNKGLGLGLNIVQRTAALLGHSLELNSQIGRGTCFGLSLPLVAKPLDAPQGVLTDQPAPSDFKGALALVIEDDDLVRTALAGLLQGWGLSVVAACDLPDALSQMRFIRVPDIIISDFRLQGDINGIELVQRLQAQWGQQVAACLMSGDTDATLMQAAQHAGLTLLHKPVRPAKLRNLLRRLLEAQRDSAPDWS